MTNCSPFIGKKTRGLAGEGVQGTSRGEYLGAYAWVQTKKAPGVCGNSLRRHVLAPLIHGN